MDTIFPKRENHNPKWILIDANKKILGRLASEISNLLRAKENSYFSPNVDQGNYVIVLNANKIILTGNKEKEKLYFRNSQRPGSLKVETLLQLRKRRPCFIIEKAVKGMLPKSILGRMFFRRLYVYTSQNIKYKPNFLNFLEKNKQKEWI